VITTLLSIAAMYVIVPYVSQRIADDIEHGGWQSPKERM
jgi:hypothetical protein